MFSAAVNRVSWQHYEQSLVDKVGERNYRYPIAPACNLVTMELWSDAQREYAIKSYYKNNDSYMSVQRAFRNHFNIPLNNSIRSAHVLKTRVEHFEETESTPKRRAGRVKNICTPENVERVHTALLRCPFHSGRHHAISLGIYEQCEDFTQRSTVPSI